MNSGSCSEMTPSWKLPIKKVKLTPIFFAIIAKHYFTVKAKQVK